MKQLYLDPGNHLVKYGANPLLNQGRGLFPHLAAEINAITFEAADRLAKTINVPPLTFMMTRQGVTTYWKVGDAAIDGGATITGAQKYHAGHHFASLFAGAAHGAYPEGCESLAVTVLHPVDINKEDGNAILNQIKGKTIVRVVGSDKPITFLVKAITMLPEPICGFFCATLNSDGALYSKDTSRPIIFPGFKILSIDIGGGLTQTQIITIDKTGNPIVEDIGNPLFVGIQSMIEHLRREIRQNSQKFPELAKLQDVPMDTLKSIISTKQYVNKAKRNHVVDCDQEVTSAFNATIKNAFLPTYNQRYGGGQGYDYIIISGGGGGILIDLMREILSHDYVFQSTYDPNDAVYGNIMGGKKISLNAETKS